MVGKKNKKKGKGGKKTQDKIPDKTSDAMHEHDEEKKPHRYGGLVVVGDVANMREAAKDNPHLAKLLSDAPISDGQRQIQTGGAKPEDTGKALENWKLAMKFEEEKGENRMDRDVNAITIGDDKSSSEKPTTAKPTQSSISRVYSHDLGKGEPGKYDLLVFPKLNQTVSAAWIDALSIDDDDTGKDESSKASTEATGSGEDNAFGGISAKAKGDKPESQKPLPKFREPGPGEEKSFMQTILENGASFTRFNQVDIKEVDTTGAKDTAEILKRAVSMDTIPTDPLTREHFGFSKCENADGEVNLVGLYTGLFLYLNVTAAQVHEWQTDNKLAGEILEAYSPQESGYLKWFMKNKHLVDANYVRPGGQKAPPAQGERISENFYDD